jgi:hypothetical protein
MHAPFIVYCALPLALQDGKKNKKKDLSKLQTQGSRDFLSKSATRTVNP